MKIFLVGMMGSGKSYWMDRLAKKLKLPKYDLDGLIEAVEDRTIPQIFKESGEDHFRKMESIVLKWFADKDEFILATGGGTPCYHNNMEWMNKEGITFWIDEPVEKLSERLIVEKGKRPLIKNLTGKKLEKYLFETCTQREPYYRQAKFTIKGDNINENDLLSLIKQSVNA